MIKAEGLVFGRLTVLRRVKKYDTKMQYVLVRCECGTEKEVRFPNLRDGKTTSCGCLKREIDISRGLTFKQIRESKVPLSKLHENVADWKALETSLRESLHAEYNLVDYPSEIVPYIRFESVCGQRELMCLFYNGVLCFNEQSSSVDYFELQTILSKYKPV